LESKFLQNSEFEFGLGEGVGHHFPYLSVEIQGNMINKALIQQEFGFGFGLGLAKSFNHLDSILEKEILNQASSYNAFSHSLGFGLGAAFPSFNEQSQNLLVEMAKRKNLFSKGFLDGIHPSLKYLDKKSLMQISTLIENQDLSKTDPVSKENNLKCSLANTFLYDYFVGLDTESRHDGLESSMAGMEEVSFFGERTKCCVCFIDMISSTKITSQLNDVELSKYYSIFLNSMATIINNFNGKIIKNVGDALLYYFPNTAGAELRPSDIKDVLECGVTMMAAHSIINSRMQEEHLPPINFRISSDYGTVEIAKSQSSQSDDLFGFAISICSKINRKSHPNGMIIGHELYNVARLLEKEYVFSTAEKIYLALPDRNEYLIYHVSNNPQNKILHPFKHKSI
jgi:class 3 adenylate cyclase